MTLVEAITSCLILGLLVSVVFAVFQLGTRSFRTLLVRQGIQSEARRVSALLRRDLVVTHFRSTSTVDRTSPMTPAPLNERDILCFSGLDNWSDASNFDDTLKPQWNRYIQWYATTIDPEEEPPYGKPELGQLVRKEVVPNSPAPPIAFPLPMLDPMPDTLTATPSGGGDAYRILSRNVLHFSITTDSDEENVLVHLILRQPGFQSATGLKRENETFECFIEMRPENTWPGL
ncbi:MAG: hypothetical protein AB1758_11170 [Candidatus Eremiobacterota bacterium]